MKNFPWKITMESILSKLIADAIGIECPLKKNFVYEFFKDLCAYQVTLHAYHYIIDFFLS